MWEGVEAWRLDGCTGSRRTGGWQSHEERSGRRRAPRRRSSRWPRSAACSLPARHRRPRSWSIERAEGISGLPSCDSPKGAQASCPPGKVVVGGGGEIEGGGEDPATQPSRVDERRAT